MYEALHVCAALGRNTANDVNLGMFALAGNLKAGVDIIGAATVGAIILQKVGSTVTRRSGRNTDGGKIVETWFIRSWCVGGLCVSASQHTGKDGWIRSPGGMGKGWDDQPSQPTELPTELSGARGRAGTSACPKAPTFDKMRLFMPGDCHLNHNLKEMDKSVCWKRT